MFSQGGRGLLTRFAPKKKRQIQVWPTCCTPAQSASETRGTPCYLSIPWPPARRRSPSRISPCGWGGGRPWCTRAWPAGDAAGRHHRATDERAAKSEHQHEGLKAGRPTASPPKFPSKSLRGCVGGSNGMLNKPWPGTNRNAHDAYTLALPKYHAALLTTSCRSSLPGCGFAAHGTARYVVLKDCSHEMER